MLSHYEFGIIGGEHRFMERYQAERPGHASDPTTMCETLGQGVDSDDAWACTELLCHFEHRI